MTESRSNTDAVQGFLALVAITLGVVPLVRLVSGGEVGRLLSWVPGTDADPGRWLVPVGVLVVAVVLIAVLERRGRSR